MNEQRKAHLRKVFEEYMLRVREGHPHWKDNDLDKASIEWHLRNGIRAGEFPFPWAPIADSPADPLPFCLLTGAGFSKGWGGLLVREMTARVLSSKVLNRAPEIRQDLLRSSYEELLAEYRQAPHCAEKEIDLQRAIEDAYDFQDRLHCRNSHLNPSIGSMMRLIIQPALGRGFAFFTLNHDLVVERRWPEVQMGTVCDCPGIRRCPTNDAPATGLVNEFDIETPIVRRGHCQYFKLHGSKNWKETIEGQTRTVMIAGAEKINQIRNFTTPAGKLLSAYFDFFESAVGNGTTVLVIGYSFSDEHVNRVLARKGVRIAVVDPGGFPTQTAGGSAIGMRLNENAAGVWPMAFADLFGRGGFTNDSDYPSVLDLKECLSL